MMNSRRSFLPRADASAAMAFAILAGLSAYRARLVDQAYGSYASCSHCLDSSVWANDALLFGAFALLIAGARLVTSLAARIALAAIAVVAICAYAGDLLVFQLLNHRLLAVDVVRFARDADHFWSVVRLYFQHAEGITFALAWIALAILACRAIVGAPMRRAAIAWATVSAALAAAWLAVPQAQYIHDESFRNLWQVNRDQDPTRAYTRAFWEKADKTPLRQIHCERGRQDPVSVILVVVESLSASHSRLFSGLHDFTPNLDRIARGAAYFPNFRSNGFSTETGLISMLTGEAPIPTAGWSGGVMAFTDVDGDFHRWLASRGYDTAFFTSGEIGVGQRDRWLKTIGIGHIEGAEATFYDGMSRGSFNAAEDAALVDRFLQWQALRPRSKPFMATVLTVATHPPFYSPVTHVQSEAASFREADRQVARLVAILGERGFFDHGVMVILGDHRAMTPIPPEEFQRFGASAPVRVPAIAIGRTGLSPGAHAEPLQQTDLIPSLRHLIAAESCRTDLQGAFLGGPIESARYLVHNDPLHRNIVVLQESGREYRLVLDGDDTRWIDAPASSDEASALLGEVNRERMSRMAEFRPAGS